MINGISYQHVLSYNPFLPVRVRKMSRKVGEDCCLCQSPQEVLISSA